MGSPGTRAISPSLRRGAFMRSAHRQTISTASNRSCNARARRESEPSSWPRRTSTNVWIAEFQFRFLMSPSMTTVWLPKKHRFHARQVVVRRAKSRHSGGILGRRIADSWAGRRSRRFVGSGILPGRVRTNFTQKASFRCPSSSPKPKAVTCWPACSGRVATRSSGTCSFASMASNFTSTGGMRRPASASSFSPARTMTTTT